MKNSMTDKQLQDALQSMGMACFIEYYYEFCNLSLSTDYIAQLMLDDRRGWTTILHRATTGRRIVKAGRVEDALTIIVGSRANAQARRQAKLYLDEITQR